MPKISKKKIKQDVLQILKEANIDKSLWEKVLNSMVNYTYRIAIQQTFPVENSTSDI